MLILIKWMDENGGLFQTTDGRTVYLTVEDLKNKYYPFIHNSPKGESRDIEIFVARFYFD